MARQRVSHVKGPTDATDGSGSLIVRLVVVIACVAAVGAMVYRARGLEMPVASVLPAPVEGAPLTTSSPGPAAGSSGEITVSPQASAESAALPSIVAPTLSPSAQTPRVGIVSGHWGHDTGAECEDGLLEVDVNLDIATQLVQILLSRGYEVDLLQEFDARLHGYYADVLVSIHADSCQPFPDANPPMSGFKVASVIDSSVPDEEMRLVTCMARRYADRTGMYYHASTVTPDMTQYHTFYEIDPRTPAAIIETGFMWADREILTQQPGLIAQAIADGIVCFLAGEETP